LRNDAVALKVFDREAKLLAQVRDNHIVAIHHVLEQDDQSYLVMEFVEGQTLGEVIAKSRMPPERGEDILQDILAGLKVIHEEGILHRDLKPANILLDGKGTAKISDFGIAERTEDEALPMNFGSVKYMAPELYRTGDSKEKLPVDPRSDIYALGIIAYEMLLGENVFKAECQKFYPTETEIQKSEIPTRWINWHMDPQLNFRPLAEVDPQIPDGLSKIVERMTRKDLQQ